MIRTLLLFFIIAWSSTITAALASETAEQIVDRARKECNAIRNGEFHASDKAISRMDLTGDGREEEIVDASQFSCSTAAQPFCGTGGCPLTVIVDEKPYRFLAHGWKVVDWHQNRILLLAVYFSECGDTVEPCYRAMVWRGEDFAWSHEQP